MPSPRIPCQRELFDIPDDVSYLNCAYMSPQLEAVSRAGTEAVGLKATPWKVSAEHWFERVEVARSQFARVIGSSADDIALIPSASYGIATAARNCAVEDGQTIVVIAEQFPSCVYPWRRKVAESGGEIVTVSRPVDGDWTSAILEKIDERCAVVTLPAFHWADGGRIDLVPIGRAVRSKGARLVLDLSQSVGAAPFDIAEVDPDWLCAPAYKWLLGPYSAGFLYVAPRNHEGIPLEENWIVRRGAEDFSRLVDYQNAYCEGARRYDVGERSNFVLLPMMIAGLEQVLAWGVEGIASSLGLINAQLEKIAAEADYVAIADDARAPHILGLTREGGLPKDLVARLREHSVYAGARGDSLRVAPHLHVNEDDLERFRRALRASL